MRNRAAFIVLSFAGAVAANPASAAQRPVSGTAEPTSLSQLQPVVYGQWGPPSGILGDPTQTAGAEVGGFCNLKYYNNCDTYPSGYASGPAWPPISHHGPDFVHDTPYYGGPYYGGGYSGGPNYGGAGYHAWVGAKGIATSGRSNVRVAHVRRVAHTPSGDTQVH